MKKRNIAAVVILHIITLGIYFFYWAYATRKDLVAQHGDPKSIPAFKWLVLPFALLIPLPFLFLSLPFSEATEPNVFVILGIFADLITLVIASMAVFLWWFYHYCKVAWAVTKGIEFTPSYVMFIMTILCNIPVIWQALMQNDINKAADRIAAKKPSAAKSAA